MATKAQTLNYYREENKRLQTLIDELLAALESLDEHKQAQAAIAKAKDDFRREYLESTHNAQ